MAYWVSAKLLACSARPVVCANSPLSTIFTHALWSAAAMQPCMLNPPPCFLGAAGRDPLPHAPLFSTSALCTGHQPRVRVPLQALASCAAAHLRGRLGHPTQRVCDGGCGTGALSGRRDRLQPRPCVRCIPAARALVPLFAYERAPPSTSRK